MKLKLVTLAVLAGMTAQSSFGDDTCSKDGGLFACLPLSTTPWSTKISPCTNIDRLGDVSYCTALYEGRYTGWETGCADYSDITDSNMVKRFTNYASVWSNYFGGPISGVSDSGWNYNTTPEKGVCWDSPAYDRGIQVNTVRKLQFFTNNKPTVYVMGLKTRQVTCPQGSIIRNGQCTSPTKTLSCPSLSSSDDTPNKVGNPCSVTTGNKSQNETDWASPNSPLKITRTYNSAIYNQSSPWSLNYNAQLDIGQVRDIKLALDTQSLKQTNSVIRLTRSDGSLVIAQRNYTDHTLAGNSEWFIDRDMSLQLTGSGNTWQVKNVKTGVIETYQAVVTATEQPVLTVASTPTPTTSPTVATENLQFKLTRLDYPNGQFIKLGYQNGELVTATDQLGSTLSYRYDANGKLAQIGLPNGKTIDYGYDSLGRLSTVKRPGYGVKTYVYDEADKAPNDNPNLLTGIIDENGKRYASYAYDSANRGVLTEHAGDTQKFTLTFANGSTQVTDEYGNNRNYTLNSVSGTNRITHLTNGNQDITNQYDQGGNLISQTKNGLTTKYTYDQSRNLETSKIEAFGTANSRITLTEWATNLPVKTKITKGSANPDGSLKQALRITSFTYDDKGNALTKTITDPQTNESRTWSYTYNANTQKTSETNPQGQITKWAYDNKGNLTQSTDAQGLITAYSDYNADNKPQTITSPTGQVTKLTYDDAGRILTQTVTIGYPSLTDISKKADGWIDFQNWWKKAFNAPLLPNSVKFDISKQSQQTATTSYQYDGVGQLIKTTLPDGQVISYQYDDAHRMVGMTDSLGNKISYTLNGAGDIIETQNRDPQGQLANSHKQSYDTLGRLTADTGNNGQNQRYSYDSQDNLTQTQDALARTTGSQYDSLKRKIQDTDANGQPVKYTYNALDQLLTVTDSNNVTTSYTYNAFGDVLTTQSPDTGTATNQYNAKGQLVSQTDGANRTQAYTYDDKGRLTGRADSTGKVLASYSYDDKGRINKLTDPSGQTTYQYNSNNQLIEKVQTTEQTTLTTRYHYTVGGQLDEIRYPSGQLVVYQYDKGILTGVQVKTTDNQTVQVIDSIRYSPNGIKGYNWSQSKQTVSYQYDTDGRLTQINDPALQRSYQYDVGNRITNVTDSKANISQLFSHDKLDRLTSQTQGTSKFGYSYDNNSNRTQKTTTTNGIAQTSNTPVKAGTNQYQGYSYDTSGKTINDGQRSYSYNSEGRIERIQNGSIGVVNVYNALGQRVQKNSGNAKTYFSYDEQGKLVGEYDTQGNAIREYLYLGNAPISLISSEKAGQVLSIHSDHLGTPRAILGANSEVLWRWEGEAFGADSPSVASIKMPLRFAGQYADDETGLFYNYFRFYDPKTGRYVENDPIDLQGGLNRWGYVGGNPLLKIDPMGKMATAVAGAEAGASVGALGGPAGVMVGGIVGGIAGAVIGIIAADMIHDAIQDDTDTKVKEDDCDDKDKSKVYHREKSPTQTDADMQQIISSGMLCGKGRRQAGGGYSPFASAKAYVGPLNPSASGFEFKTSIKPTSQTPATAVWTIGTPGVFPLGDDLACIPITVTKVQP